MTLDEKLRTTNEAIQTSKKKEGSLFYISGCVGKNQKSFQLYKFRTMHINADEKFLELAKQNGLDNKGNIQDDPRITPTGRFLRKYWIDELPQVVNILKGDIKFVEIRPMSAHHWTVYPEDIMLKAQQQKPGFMGVNYAGPKNARSEEVYSLMRSYLDEYVQKPLRTEIKYLTKIITRIVFHGVRSS